MSRLVDVSQQGWLSRGKNSVLGALFGALLVLISVILTFMNEGRSVARYKDLQEGAGRVISVAGDRVDPVNEGKLVHLSAMAVPNAAVKDEDFGQAVEGIKLIRRVEMFQWQQLEKTERREKIGGGVETTRTYSYSQGWSDKLIDSDRFHQPAGHTNPKSFPFPSVTQIADQVSLGAFQLPAYLVKGISGGQPHPVASLESASPTVRQHGKIYGGGVFVGANPETPAVGEVRVSFQVVPAGEFTVVSQQQGGTFTSYITTRNNKLDLIKRGNFSAAQMFETAHQENKILTWALRLGGFFMMFAGFSLILAPLSVMASVIPLFGRIAAAGTKLIALLMAGILWTVVVSVAWIFYRPVLGIILLVITVALFILATRLLSKARNPQPSANPSLPPQFPGAGGPQVPPPLT